MSSPIRATVYSASNDPYQHWQCDLLDWSFRKVGQPGRLIRLMSESLQDPGRPFPASEVAETVALPSWADDGDPWPIRNKPESLRVWLATTDLAESDAVLLLDPDMLFLGRVDLDVQRGSILGQRWIGPEVPDDDAWATFAPELAIAADEIVMYPFAATVGDLRQMVDEFVDVSEEIHHRTGRWWSDMYAHVIAAKRAGLTIATLDDLGTCNHWSGTRRLIGADVMPSIIHYPWPVRDAADQDIWSKQMFTPFTSTDPWRDPPGPDAATNPVEVRLLAEIHDYISRQRRRPPRG